MRKKGEFITAWLIRIVLFILALFWLFFFAKMSGALGKTSANPNEIHRNPLYIPTILYCTHYRTVDQYDCKHYVKQTYNLYGWKFCKVIEEEPVRECVEWYTDEEVGHYFDTLPHFYDE